jgi:molecular chaperone DnaK
VNEAIFGIDLGTTNSCLAVLEPGGPRVIDVEGEPIVPSVVGLDPERGGWIVGRRARNRLALDPDRTVRSIKRRMGESERLRVGDRNLLPEEIAAEILRFLKEEGERALGRPVRRAVITVPAYFGDAQRRATIRAGELAGLEVVRLLNEPTAAALVYDRVKLRGIGSVGGMGGIGGMDGAAPRRSASGEVQRVLVYDLGGGTFDVSVVEIGGGVNEVRASCGDNHLGGDDFDALLAEHLLDKLRERHGRDLAPTPRLRARLTDAAERAKIDLSVQPYARVMEEALAPGVHLDVEIERRTFEGLVHGHLDKTMVEVDRALQEARVSPERIDRVVLVGGSTRIPKVVEMLEARFACPVEHSVDPALGVALGAALQGAILGGQVFDQILVDVAAHSLGVKTLDNVFEDLSGEAEADYFSAIIHRNTQIPATRSQVYYTVTDGQRQVKVEVYQGESERCSDNALIGRFVMDLQPMRAPSPVVAEFSYDLDGIVRVVVSQKGTDRRKEVTLSTRQREPETGGRDERRAVDNYILRKARTLAASLPAGELADRLRAAAAAYEAALQTEPESPETLDDVEGDLLDLLEEAEEVTAGREP